MIEMIEQMNKLTWKGLLTCLVGWVFVPIAPSFFFFFLATIQQFKRSNTTWKKKELKKKKKNLLALIESFKSPVYHFPQMNAYPNMMSVQKPAQDIRERIENFNNIVKI